MSCKPKYPALLRSKTIVPCVTLVFGKYLVYYCTYFNNTFRNEKPDVFTPNNVHKTYSIHILSEFSLIRSDYFTVFHLRHILVEAFAKTMRVSSLTFIQTYKDVLLMSRGQKKLDQNFKSNKISHFFLPHLILFVHKSLY